MVEMVGENVTMSKVLSRASFENAIRVNSAIGGSSNAVVHLLAIAGRAGIALDLSDFDALGAALPCILNLRPAGAYLMEDFFEARSEERRVGKECVSTCKSRGSPSN